LRHELLIIIVLSVTLGITIFLVCCKIFPVLFVHYKSYFSSKIEHGIKHHVLFIDFALFIRFHILLTIVLIIIGYGLLSYTGIILGIIMSIMLPGVILTRLQKTRTHDFVAQLPDVLTSISTSLKAGGNLSRAFDQVVIQQSNPASQEFRLILSEYKMGKSIQDSLKDMADRMSCYEVDLMVSAITISRGIGGNLAATLEVLSDTVRKKSYMEEKIKALTAMGRMQGWVVGLIPVVVFFIMQQQEAEAMKAMYNEPLGWMVLGCVSVMSLLAAFMIFKIVNIDI